MFYEVLMEKRAQREKVASKKMTEALDGARAKLRNVLLARRANADAATDMIKRPPKVRSFQYSDVPGVTLGTKIKTKSGGIFDPSKPGPFSSDFHKGSAELAAAKRQRDLFQSANPAKKKDRYEFFGM